MFNLTVLKKTLIPSKDGLLLLAGVVGLIVVCVIIVAAVTLALQGVYWLLAALLDKTAAGLIIAISLCALYFWWFIVEPLMARYERIKRELDDAAD